MFRFKLLIPAVFLAIVFFGGPTPKLHAHGGGHGGGGHGGHGGFGGHGGYYGGHHGYGYHGYGFHGYGFGYPGFGYGFSGFGMGGFGLYGLGGFGYGGLGYGGLGYGGLGYGRLGYGGLGYGGLGYGGLGYGGLGYGGLGYAGFGMRGMGYGGMMMGGMMMGGMGMGGCGYGGYGYGGYGGISSGCGCMYMPPISAGPIAPVPAAVPANPGNAPLPVPNRVSSASRYTDYYARNSNPPSSSAIAARPAGSGPRYIDYYAAQTADSSLRVANQSVSRTSATQEIANKARLHLHVPADAVVRLNGRHMRTTGEERDYLSPELEEGETYAYDIQVTWTQEGQQREESREVKVRANKTTTVRFGDASLAKR